MVTEFSSRLSKGSQAYPLGKGIYTLPEAARLSKVSSRRIRYWLGHIESEQAKEERERVLWQGQHEPIDAKMALGFLDLQEVRFVEAFLKAGVSWRLLRLARDRYETEHPFCTRRFATDGKHIIEFLAVEGLLVECEEIAKSQKVFPEVVRPFFKELEFSADDRLLRWWPLGMKRGVVLDPDRQFGQPIVTQYGVATEVLYLAVKSGDSEEAVAAWFEVDREAIRDAIEFAERLAA
jgi:uncharacterized protein (DUF433 family)